MSAAPSGLSATSSAARADVRSPASAAAPRADEMREAGRPRRALLDELVGRDARELAASSVTARVASASAQRARSATSSTRRCCSRSAPARSSCGHALREPAGRGRPIAGVEIDCRGRLRRQHVGSWNPGAKAVASAAASCARASSGPIAARATRSSRVRCAGLAARRRRRDPSPRAAAARARASGRATRRGSTARPSQ